jgi:hypothetical protein
MYRKREAIDVEDEVGISSGGERGINISFPYLKLIIIYHTTKYTNTT